MKKLRLISSVLAFVMVAALMVPALTVLIAAGAADVLPAGDTIGAWNIGWPGGKVTTSAEATGTVDNPFKGSAWAGLEYETTALQQVEYDSSSSLLFEGKDIDLENFAGLMFDAKGLTDNNNAFYMCIVVDDVAYYSLAKLGDETNEATRYAGATAYIQGENGWTAVSNMDYGFSGVDEGDTPNAFQRAIRYPANYDGKIFVPLDTFRATWEGPRANYNKGDYGPKINAPQLTTEILAAATTVQIYLSAVWKATPASFSNVAAVHYVTPDLTEVLPAGETLKAWNIAWPGGKVNSSQGIYGTATNYYADAAWAGAEFQTEPLEELECSSSSSHLYDGTITDLDNFYGFMFDAKSGSGANHAFYLCVIVDNIAYFSLAKMGDTEDENTRYHGATAYLKGDKEWVALSNMDYEFSGVDEGDTPNSFQRAIRYPGEFDGQIFVPLDTFYTTWEGPRSAYNTTAPIINATPLTKEILANAVEVQVYLTRVWHGADVPTSATNLQGVYSMDYIPKVVAPATLPGVDTAEWEGHAAYGGFVKDKYPATVAVDVAIAGKPYFTGDNLISETISVAGANAAGNVTIETPVLADANIAGILLKVKSTGSANNQGVSFGFRANGNLYVSNTQFAENTATPKAGTIATYIYDGVNTPDGWLYYRDPGSHTTFRACPNFDGFVFLPIDTFFPAVDQAATVSYRQTVTYGPSNAVPDLTTAGISEILVGTVWDGSIDVLGVSYVYVDGYNAVDDGGLLPGAEVNAWAQSWLNNAQSTAADAAGVIANPVASFQNAVYASADLGAGEAADASVNGKFLKLQKYAVSGLSKETLGFAIDMSIAAANNNNGFVAALVVDGVAYYSVSFAEGGSTNFIRMADSSKWVAVNNKIYDFAGIAADNANLYQRAIRLPAGLNGTFFAPVESFFTAYAGAGLDGYNGDKAAAETQLTAEVLAAATSVELYAFSTWSDTITFGNAALIEKGPYVELAPVGDKPATLPAVEDLKFRTDYNLNYFDDVVADNAVTPIDALWGAAFTTSAEVGENDLADLGGFLVSVNNAAGGVANITISFDSIAKKDDGTTPKFQASFDTNNGRGAKPAYLWQGEQWVVEGTSEGFTIPAGYTGYIYIPVTSLSSGNNTAESFVAGMTSFSAVLFSDFVGDLADYTLTGLTCTAADATVEYVWVDGLAELIAEPEKPTHFPVNAETPLYGYGAIFEYATENAFQDSWTVSTTWGTAEEPVRQTTNATAISADRSMPGKFNGVGMLTQPLVSVGGIANSASAPTLTMAVDGTPVINAATAAGLLIKANVTAAAAGGLGIDFGIKVGDKIYRHFNNSANTSYDKDNGLIYTYNNYNHYTDATWSAHYGDSKIRLQGSMDGYIFVPFALLRAGAETLDLATLAAEGISEVYAYAMWDAYDVTIESVEVASAAATIGGASVSVGDDLSLNVSAIVSGTPATVAMNFIIGENTVSVDGVAGENGAYTFTLNNIGAHQMMDLIDLELVVDGAVISTVEGYSITKYATNLLGKTDDDKLKTLLVDLLYYGEAMQVLLGYNVENLPTAELSADQLELRSLNTIARDRSKIRLSDEVSENAQWKSFGIVLDGGIKLVIKGVVLNTAGISASIVDGETTTTIDASKWGVESNEYTIVYNVGICTLANSLSATFVKDGTVDGATYTLSANGAIVAIYKDEASTAEQKEAALSLYLLGTSVAAYMN